MTSPLQSGAGETPALRSPPFKAPLSPRRRRLRWTMAILALVFLASLIVGAIVIFKSRSRPYHPDEANAEITSSLSLGLPANAPQPRFANVTGEAGLAAFRTFAGHRTSQLPEDMGPGVAWGDFDNDGDDDLFLVSAGGPLSAPAADLLRCELFENLGTRSFRRIESFPDIRIHGMGAAWGDYDGDGYLDLVVSGYDALLLFRNESGAGTFRRDTRFPDLKGFWAGRDLGTTTASRPRSLVRRVQCVENDSDRHAAPVCPTP